MQRPRRVLLLGVAATLLMGGLHPTAAAAQRPEVLVQRLLHDWQYLDCNGWDPNDCAPTCGYESAESSGIACVGSPRRLQAAVTTLRARWGEVEPWLVERLLASPDDGEFLDQAAAATMFVGRASPALIEAVAAAFMHHPSPESALVLEREIALNGAGEWVVAYASTEASTLSHEAYWRRVLSAALRHEGGAPPAVLPHLVRRHHELLALVPPAQVANLAATRWPQIRSLAERESLAETLGVIARDHDGHRPALFAVLRGDRNAEMFFSHAAVEAESETVPSPGLLAEYARSYAAPNTRRALELEGHFRVPASAVCGLDPTRFTDERFVEGMVLVMYPPGHDEFSVDHRWGRQCDEASQRLWSEWLLAHREGRTVTLERLRRWLGELDFDVLLRFSEIIEGNRGRSVAAAVDQWCRALGDEEDSTRAQSAIGNLVDAFSGFGRTTRGRINFCADRDRTYATVWADAFAEIVARFDYERVKSALTAFLNMPRRANAASRDRFLASMRSRAEELATVREPRQRAELDLNVLSLEWAAMGYPAEGLARMLAATAEWDLTDDEVRVEAMVGLTNAFSIRYIVDSSVQAGLLAELERAVALLDDPSPELQTLIQEVRDEIALWRPLHI